MVGIKINPEKLEGYIGQLNTGYQQVIENTLEAEPEVLGAGKAEEELKDYNFLSDMLIDSLAVLYEKMETFLTNAKEGIVDADTSAARQMRK